MMLMLMALFVGLLLLLVRDHEMTGVLVGHPHAHESQNKQHLPFPLSSQFLNDYPVFTLYSTGSNWRIEKAGPGFQLILRELPVPESYT